MSDSGGGDVQSIGLGATAVTGQLATTRGVCKGWSFRETSGVNPATVELWNGYDTKSSLIVSISLKAGESTRDYLPDQGISITRGIFLNVVLGTFTGSVYFAPADPR